MSDYVKLSLAATTLCMRDAHIDDIPAFADNCAAVLGTAHGSTNYCESYYGQIVTEGLGAANPMLFAEGVPNAAAAHLSLMLAIKGPCQTIIGSRTSGLDAIRVAATRIASGEWHRAVVGAAEEYSPVVNEAYRHHGLYGADGYVAGAGAVTFLLESRASVESRRGRARARVNATAGAQATPPNVPRLARRLLGRIDAPRLLLTSANHTWLARAEFAAVRGEGTVVSSPYGYIADCASALPLAAIAAVLLTGRMPRQIATLPDMRRIRAATGDEPAGRFASIATDYAGAVATAAFERVD